MTLNYGKFNLPMTLHVRLPGSYISMLPSEHLCLFRAACFKAFTYLWVTLYGCWCQRQTPLSLDLSLVFREKCGLKRLFLPIISKSYYFDLPQRTTKSRRLRFSLQISLSVHLIAKSLSLRGALVLCKTICFNSILFQRLSCQDYLQICIEILLITWSFRPYLLYKMRKFIMDCKK